MIVSKSEYLQEASNTVYKMVSDREIRERCQSREDYLYWERIKNNQHTKKLTERDAQLATAFAKIAELEAKQK